jgi:ribose transport system substrate-binding protein
MPDRRFGNRAVLAAAAAGALACALSACSSSSTSSTPAASTSSPASTSSASDASTPSSKQSAPASGGSATVAFVPGIAKIPFYDTLWAGVEQEAKALGWKSITQGSTSAFSVAAQTPFVNAVCAEHPNYLLIAPTDPVSMRAPIQQCMNEGVKVILVDTTLTNSAGIISAVSSNNTLGGQLAAQFVARQLGGKGLLSVQSGNPEAETQAARREGFVNYLKSNDSGFSFLQTIYTNSESSGETDTAATLTSSPNVSVIFNVTSTCQGPSQAIQTHGGNKPLLICYDDSPTVTTLLEQGKVAATVLQDPRNEGVTAVKYAYDDFTGKTSSIPKSTVVTPVLITSSEANSATAKKYLYVN